MSLGRTAFLNDPDADISDYPDLINKDLSSQITIGDLHGNALKLVYFLMENGVLQLGEDEYEQFSKFYLACTAVPGEPFRRLVRKELDQFNRMLDQATINPDAQNNKNLLVRLIGDEMADRGANDYFTLKVLEKLRLGQVPVEILFSNHGVEFIEAMEHPEGIVKYVSKGLDINGQVNSLLSLQDLIKYGLVGEAEVKKLYAENYQPFFKAISYTLKDNRITIYTHAPVGLEVIEEIAKKFKIPYQDDSAENLAKTIDLINDKFQEHVRSGTVKSLYVQSSKDNRDIQPADDPFALLMWKRDGKNYTPKRDETHNSYTVEYVHGHDGSPGKSKNIFNLNNGLGQFNNVEGDYAIVKAKGVSRILPLKRPPQDSLPVSSSPQNIYDKYKADELGTDALLKRLSEAINRKNMEYPLMHEAAKRFKKEAENLSSHLKPGADTRKGRCLLYWLSMFWKIREIQTLYVFCRFMPSIRHQENLQTGSDLWAPWPCSQGLRLLACLSLVYPLQEVPVWQGFILLGACDGRGCCAVSSWQAKVTCPKVS